jgi:hypothetical protein
MRNLGAEATKKRVFTTEGTEGTEEEKKRVLENSVFCLPLCPLCPLW